MPASSSRLSIRPALVAGLAFLMVAASLAVTSQAQAKKIRPGFFGMHDSWISGGSVPGVQTGATRLWDTGTSWREIETAPGVFDWSTVDAAVNTARGAGIRPMLVLGQTPQFHAKNPLAPGAYGDGATSMPDVAAWKNYVRKAANRYKNTVDYQIWNEPNVVNYWTGSQKQMAILTKTASAQIPKKFTVVAPAFPLRLEGQRTWYRKYWSTKVSGKGMASYVDVVAANLYPLAPQAPEASMKLLKFAKRALPKAARGKPLWNTEINYGLLGGATAKEISNAKQAAFVGRTMLLNAASPVRRMYWYSWAIGPIANTHLVEDDRTTLTRAGRAWRVAHKWVVGTDVKKCAKTSKGRLKGLYTCTARESRREVRRFYWKPSGSAVKIRTHRTTSQWADLTGDARNRKGRFSIKVGKAPIMVVSRR